MTLDWEVLGWPADGVRLRLDHREFAYAGKFVMTNTGKAVARSNGETVGAASFSPDRTDAATAWIRYVTVARNRRGERVGPRLLAFVAARLDDAGYERVRIAVNNPFAYQAAYRAGFEWTGETTGLAELVCVRPPDEGRAGARYRAGLAVYADRDLTPAERAFLDAHADDDPPTVLGAPSSACGERGDGGTVCERGDGGVGERTDGESVTGDGREGAEGDGSSVPPSNSG